jgi:hypothetical protein
MTVLIEDACFSAGAKIRVDGAGTDLAFRHCSFEGCDIFVADAVQQMIFTRCLFRGAVFSGQPLSSRISSECQRGCAEMEMTASAPGSLQMRFRR